MLSLALSNLPSPHIIFHLETEDEERERKEKKRLQLPNSLLTRDHSRELGTKERRGSFHRPKVDGNQEYKKDPLEHRRHERGREEEVVLEGSLAASFSSRKTR